MSATLKTTLLVGECSVGMVIVCMQKKSLLSEFGNSRGMFVERDSMELNEGSAKGEFH
jgi:hypothetical protein